MPRLWALGLAVALLAAFGCKSSTGLECDPETTLDCGFVIPPSLSLTVSVTLEDGTAVTGASVRLDGLTSCCSGFYFVETTDVQGRALFGFFYRRDSPSLPIEVLVTPPAGSPFSATTVSDTVVFVRNETRLVLPVVLTQLVPE